MSREILGQSEKSEILNSREPWARARTETLIMRFVVICLHQRQRKVGISYYESVSNRERGYEIRIKMNSNSDIVISERI